jgi:hypothetical protein
VAPLYLTGGSLLVPQSGSCTLGQVVTNDPRIGSGRRMAPYFRARQVAW